MQYLLLEVYIINRIKEYCVKSMMICSAMIVVIITYNSYNKITILHKNGEYSLLNQNQLINRSSWELENPWLFYVYIWIEIVLLFSMLFYPLKIEQL